MKTTNGIPDPDSVIEDLVPVLVAIMESLDKGAADARAYHLERGFKFEGALATGIVRKWVKQGLLDLKLQVEEFDVDEEVRNIGLRFSLGPCEIRIWKTRDGELPFPGRSLRKRQFMEHREQQLLGEAFALPESPGWHFVILWSVNDSFEQDSAFLVMPKAAPVSWFDPGEVYWSRTLLFEELLAMLPPPPATPDTQSRDLPFIPGETSDEDTAENQQ